MGVSCWFNNVERDGSGLNEHTIPKLASSYRGRIRNPSAKITGCQAENRIRHPANTSHSNGTWASLFGYIHFKQTDRMWRERRSSADTTLYCLKIYNEIYFSFIVSALKIRLLQIKKLNAHVFSFCSYWCFWSGSWIFDSCNSWNAKKKKKKKTLFLGG